MSTALWADYKFYGPELLQIADAVAREKSLEKEQILDAIESAIQKAAKSKYGSLHDIKVNVNRKTGEVSILKCFTVKEIVEDDNVEISLNSAKKIDATAEIGSVVTIALPPVNFGRVAAQIGKQIISQKIKDAERDKQYNEYKDKVGEIISGVVKRAEYNNVTLDIGRAEAIIKKDHLIPKENFRVGDRVRAYIYEVSRQVSGAQVFLSRTHPQFLAKLFKQEVPEVYDGIIDIKSVARDPGSRAKVAVYSSDTAIDPIGACVGLRGNRVQNIIQELQGEKIDIVLWYDDPATFVVNALAPAEVSKVIIDEENRRFEVLAPDSQLSLAIGRRGQNVRLASQLTGWNVSVVSETAAVDKQNQEYHACSKVFMEALDCDEVIAHLLVAEGFSSVEELIETPIADVADIEGFDEEIAGELVERAKAFLKKQHEDDINNVKATTIDKKILELYEFSDNMLLKLRDAGILNIDALADLASDELIEILSDLSEEQAQAIIIKAREHWFK